jgi:hypothetical protein
MSAISLRYHTSLAGYFSGKHLYLDMIGKETINTRKLVELPWHYYILNEPNSILDFIKDFSVFHEISKLEDYMLYEKFIIKNTLGYERTKGIWLIFGLHISNGEDFISASALIKTALPYIINDFSEESKEFVKAIYFLGWSRKKMDDNNGASFWFSEVRNLVSKYNIDDCGEYLRWIENES